MIVDQILDNLFVGSCPMDAHDMESLHRSGITAVLNLQTDEDMNSRGVDQQGLEQARRQMGIKEVRVPIRDFDFDHLRARLPEAVQELLSLLQAGHKVYVHCTAGMNRSPTVVIAYLHWALGWNLDLAASHVLGRHYCYPLVESISSQPVPSLENLPANLGE